MANNTLENDAETITSHGLTHFKYERLNTSRHEIRLLKVETKGAIIRSTMHHYQIESAPKFRALSYAWGPLHPRRQILVNGQHLSIRENLAQFFGIYVKEHSDDYLWVDQVCIDQTDVLERNHQVQLMSQIYGRAEQVLIWVNPNNIIVITNVATAKEVSSKAHVQAIAVD
jgi:hypothetical protein